MTDPTPIVGGAGVEAAMGAYGPGIMAQIELMQQQMVLQTTQAKVVSAVNRTFGSAEGYLEAWASSYAMKREAAAFQEAASPQSRHPFITDWRPGHSETYDASGFQQSSVSGTDLDGLVEQSAHLEAEGEEDIFADVENNATLELGEI
ncbi:MAG: hypothetical protein A3I75_00385 [Deltaproteobacteria bacterium RIFCSPLOWO2_02_FULL_50_16]|nr:MAG: hypothetical protein A3B79_05580 [Deltaproteobacteria bacterium RIFCSPHIGHO2_02_FULL_50_15]OGQ58504.1 MAG: hypothetical protein A3I75_00385 [Deltaproteobacteria bacterium RIFCSPLOWO2_02_FULL_50_16]OGQ67972.1 MAG: hypothetical protein A3F89_03595 [Deltaproteobacteria bacterium RIFCSPLOWO2_12_FULL_50_11]